MQDPVKTIKDLLYANWDTSGAIDRDDITWRYGPPEDPTTRFNEHEMSFEFNDMTGPRSKRSQARAQGRKIVTVDVWIQINPDDTIETRRTTYRQAIVDKIDSIVTANQTSATNLNFIYVGNDGRNLDNIEEDYLRSMIEIVCRYEV